jgi:GxxExxY protein
MNVNIKKICEKVMLKLGKGYTENIYQEALCVSLRELNIKYSKEMVVPVKFEGIIVGNVRADIVLNELKTVIECKAIEGELREVHLPQIITYMEHLEYNNGYYVNFIQNPGKRDIEIYNVTRDGELYNFKDITNDQNLKLDKGGRKIEDKTGENWIMTHIVYSENDILEKKDVMELYTKNKDVLKLKKNEFMKLIIERTDEFKDVIIDGKKKCCIINWKFMT